MENIELRSENIRKIIERIPPTLIRSGIGIITLIFVLLLAAAAFVPYPETLEGEVTIEENDNENTYAKGLLPYTFITQVKKDMSVEIELEGFNAREYGYQHGIISYVSPEVITNNKKNYFAFIIILKENPFIQKGMKGYVSVILSNKTLLERIISK
ncbi:HlyD family secretion protein [Bacteroides oleiciplenus]|uniref:HlyD family secretion protein n=1 Tax=Bacteroides oleiciplenus TaxID=626931 RepID=A0A3E5B1L0_9BACE|nr:HlyD family secretion protein [Bacteroides oleiciplenus]RGN31393.1 HlyD family secretion protein [Bacteroides oleiciplenus]